MRFTRRLSATLESMMTMSPRMGSETSAREISVKGIFTS